MYDENLKDKLRQTLRWRPAVIETALHFADLPAVVYEDLIRLFVNSGEDKPLSILMCICGINKVFLEPCTLAEALKVAEPVTDVSFPFKMQNSNAK